MSTFCRKLESPITYTEKLKQELKQKLTEVFSGGIRKCTKMKAQFQVKDHAQPIFLKKRNVPFAALEQMNEEVDRVCADFSTGLNQALKDHHYPLPSPEEKLNGGKIISKINYRTHIFKSRWKRILNSFFCLYRKKPLGRGVLWDRDLPIDGLFQIL